MVVQRVNRLAGCTHEAILEIRKCLQVMHGYVYDDERSGGNKSMCG